MSRIGGGDDRPGRHLGGRVPDGSRVSDYEYEVSPDRIARYPSERRDESRLLVVPPGNDPFRHERFRDLGALFAPGDVLVVNESKVLPARLLGHKPTGAPAEVLLTRPAPDSEDPRLWEALVRPGGKLKPGRVVVVAEDLRVEIVDSVAGGGRLVRLVTQLPVEEVLERHGHMPLPPYLEREAEAVDRERYQTVYARAAGSVAAPTAGLHFTEELLERMRAQDVRIARVTLHVGIGTFRPVDAEDPADHELHEEWYEIGGEAAGLIREAKTSDRRVWAVGTTTVRTLEAAADESGEIRPGTGTTSLFIRPPYHFRVVDCLLTNFHLPRSTLLMLVSSLGGYRRIMDAYREAITNSYRFYSYGDAMAVVGRNP